MENKSSKHELLYAISCVSFKLDELRLFLDTHPDCTEALVMFDECAAKRHDLLAEYNKLYGGLTSYCPNNNIDSWQWICRPMPWEGV